MSRTSSDVTPWLPKLCHLCGQPVRVSKDQFRCSFAGTGTAYQPRSTVWHVACERRVPASQDTEAA